jgi:peptidoglycan hydrolase-like protein with peptidoglycan-binding domain
MADITASVGDGGENKVHDVCLIQAMLKVVKNSKGQAYFGANYDGAFGALTKNAIVAFQKDFGLVPAAPSAMSSSGGIIGLIGKVIAMAATDKQGFISMLGPTLQKLNDTLPATHKGMRIIEGTKTVYLEGSSTGLSASKLDITGDANFEEGFRQKLANLVDQTFSQHKIVLWVTSTGHRRTFAQQAAIAPGATKAGPGESNHNFGRAADLGFKGFQWVQSDGTITKDNDWLGSLEKANAAKATAFWNKRDSIALSLGLFKLAFERIHVQAFDQATVSNPNSLAALLTTVGTMKWEAQYKSDLGFGGDLFDVGSAKQIWAGNATVSSGMLAKAKGVKVTTIKPKDIIDMQADLKRQFELADTNFLQWKPLPP